MVSNSMSGAHRPLYVMTDVIGDASAGGKWTKVGPLFTRSPEARGVDILTYSPKAQAF